MGLTKKSTRCGGGRPWTSMALAAVLSLVMVLCVLSVLTITTLADGEATVAFCDTAGSVTVDGTEASSGQTIMVPGNSRRFSFSYHECVF